MHGFHMAGDGCLPQHDRKWGGTMPRYAFYCDTCKKEFTVHLHISEMEKGDVHCPDCGGKEVHLLVAAFTAVTSKKS